MKKGLIVVMILVLCFSILTGCGNSGLQFNNVEKESSRSEEILDLDDARGSSVPYSSLKKKTDEENKNLSKGISYTDLRLKNDDILLTLKNSNSKQVNLSIEVEFYDEDNTLIDTQKEYINGFDSNTEVMSLIYMGYSIDEYDHYKIYVDAVASEDKSYRKDVEITSNDNGSQIVTQVMNNSEEEISNISVVVLFYKDGEIIFAREDSEYDIKPGRSANLKTGYPYDKNSYKNVEFDEFKVVLKEAYSYEW